MSWPTIFLGCFVIGFVLSALSFAVSVIRLPMHLHLHLPFGPHPHVPHVGHGAGVHASDAHGAGAHAPDAGVSPINFATLMAFLAWFGGTGYLLTSQFGWLTLPALVLSALSGTIGAAIVFWVMARVLWSPAENMRSVDYQMVGVLGRIGTPIRAGGTGELIYSHGGSRHSCGARSADGQAIENGTEVVVTSYERGIAYVRRWNELVQS